MKKIIPTFLLTSIFWILIFLLFSTPEQERSAPPAGPQAEIAEEPQADRSPMPVPRRTTAQREPAGQPRADRTRETHRPTQNAPQRPDYASEIIGKWQPVEGAKNPLEFTRYGTLIQWVYSTVDLRYEYSVSNDRIRFGRNRTGRIAITHEGSETYLEISDNTEYSGKYRLTKRSRPLEAVSTIAADDYPEAIIGKWQPVEGAKNPLEFTRYGTLIQWVYSTVDQRYEYAIAGNALEFDRGRTGWAVITPTSSGLYLEIYDNTDFSGRYRKTN